MDTLVAKERHICREFSYNMVNKAVNQQMFTGIYSSTKVLNTVGVGGLRSSGEKQKDGRVKKSMTLSTGTTRDTCFLNLE